MMRLILTLLFASIANAATYYVSTSGAFGNTGAIGSPWNRAAVSDTGNPKSLACSDVINFRGGTYDGPVRWYGTYSCDANTRVIFQNYCGEDVIFDNSAFTILPGASSPSADIVLDSTSSWMWFRKNPCGTGSFRLVNTNAKTDFTGAEWNAPGSCYPSCRPTGVEDIGDYNKISGLWIINTGLGISSQSSACGSEYIENIIVNSGYQSTELGLDAGLPLYIQNVNPGSCATRKTVRQNVAFGSFGGGVQLYGSSGTYITKIDFDKNVSMQMGSLAYDASSWALLVGGIGTAVVDDLAITSNILGNWISGYSRNDSFRFYQNLLTNGTITGNYVYTLSSGAGETLNLVGTLTGLTESGNRWVGPTEDGSAAGQFPSSTFVSSETTEIVTERWGVSHPETGYLTIVNGTGAATVNYTPTCSNGTVTLYEMMNFLTGSAQHVFNCDSSPHAVTMAYGGTVMQPTNSSRPLVHTGSGFRVFRLVYTATSNSLYRTSGNIKVQGNIRTQ